MISVYGVRIFEGPPFDRSSIETSVWYSHENRALLAFPTSDSLLVPEHLSPARAGHVFISHWSLQFPSVLSAPAPSTCNSFVILNLVCVHCHWGSTLKGHKGRFTVDASCPWWSLLSSQFPRRSSRFIKGYPWALGKWEKSLEVFKSLDLQSTYNQKRDEDGNSLAVQWL